MYSNAAPNGGPNWHVVYGTALLDERADIVKQRSRGTLNVRLQGFSGTIGISGQGTIRNQSVLRGHISAAQPYNEADLQAPVEPRQVFAIGLNYRDHAIESGIDIPENPIVFTKFQSSLTGPVTDVQVPGDTMDYESELVIVIGETLHNADAETALAGVAGYAVGQDFSERTVQQRPPAAQFGLGKSFPGFGPFGPAVVTPDEVGGEAANLQVTCVITGPTAQAQGVDVWTAQDGNTEDMIFPVGDLLARLTEVVTLYPGDIIFTGTPKGIGQPQGIFLQPGDVVTTSIEGLGSLRKTMV